MNLLWKFKSVSRPELVEALVVRDEIYFSSPPELNDPSETRFKFRYDYSLRYEDLVDRLRELHDAGTLASGPEDFIAQLMDGSIFEGLERILKDQIFNRFRVFCLTKTASNPLMWGHYSDNHGGLCVGLAKDRLVECCHVAVHGLVRYQDQPFTLTFNPAEDMEAMLKRLAVALFTKDSRWSYEQEVRLVTFDQPPVRHAPGAVRAVVLGFRATPEIRRRVMHWKHLKQDLRVLAARPPKERSYELDIVPVD